MKFRILFLLLFVCFYSYSQDSIATLKVKKKKIYSKAVLDNIDYKIVAIDVVGNPVESVVSSFSLTYRNGKDETITIASNSSKLNSEMISVMEQQSKLKEIKFHNIVAVTPTNTMEILPDFEEQCGIKTKKERKKKKLKRR